MRPRPYVILIPACLAVLCAAALATWLAMPAPMGMTIERRMPTDYRPQRAENVGPGAGRSVVTAGTGRPADDAWGRWPQFRGPGLNLVSDEYVPLADAWGEDGPEVPWRKTLGEGYGAPAALGGRLFLLDYDHEKQGDLVRCISLADGEEIWRHFYPIPTRGDHGVTRSVPAVDDRFVVTISPQAFVVCLDSETGQLRWSIDLVAEYGTTVPDWYAAQCPILEDGKAIIAPAGEKMMIAVDCETGKRIWEAPNPRRWKMTHSSITPMEFDGRKMYVYCASRGVVGVAADDGTLLWEYPDWIVPTANVPAPVPVGEDRIFLTGGYGAGSQMIRLVRGEDGKISAERVYELSPRVFSTYQQTPILYEEFLYGVLTKTAGATREQLACLDPTEGTVIWTSGKDHRFGWGPYVIADKKLFVIDDHGVLTMVAATPGGFRILDQALVFEERAHESWGPLTVIGGRILCRDLHTLVCVDLRAK